MYFLSAECSIFRAVGFSYSLNVLYGGIGINSLRFLILKKSDFFSNSRYNNFWSSNIQILIRNGICIHTEKTKEDPQHWNLKTMRPNQPSFKHCCGFGMFIPDPIFFIPDSGSRVKTIPDSGFGSAAKNLRILTQNIASKLSEI